MSFFFVFVFFLILPQKIKKKNKNGEKICQKLLKKWKRSSPKLQKLKKVTTRVKNRENWKLKKIKFGNMQECTLKYEIYSWRQNFMQNADLNVADFSENSLKRETFCLELSFQMNGILHFYGSYYLL